MKRIVPTMLCLFLLASAAVSQTQEDLLAGKWGIDVDVYLERPDVKPGLKGASAERLAEIKQIIGEQYVLFKSDGTFEAKMGFGAEKREGSWALDEENQTLTMTIPGDTPPSEDLTIVELSADKLSYMTKYDETPMVFIRVE